MFYPKHLILILGIGFLSLQGSGQSKEFSGEIRDAMLKASRYMVEEVSYNGGYVWYYLPDLSRRWGEMEAYETMVWVQGQGTVSMGDLFLDAYNATGNEYFYEAAEKAAAALIWGQSREGGWNYMIDFAGDRSLKQWYNTIGKNGWRLEEFHHYYGNCTFDDGVTSGAASFLLRIYLEKMDPKYRPSLEKAIDFILQSQYPIGGWPQRYPLKSDYSKGGRPDYSSYYTFNDDVTEGNIRFLIQCYLTLGREEFLEPIIRGMNSYLIFQHGSGAWGLQYDENLRPAGARSYEPAALMPGATFGNAMALLDFYEFTGETKFLTAIPRAIDWLEKSRLPEANTQGGRNTHPTFIDPETGRAIYVHRKGSNAIYGSYYIDENEDMLLGHYGGKRNIPVIFLKQRYDSLVAVDPVLVSIDSPLKPSVFEGEGTPQVFYGSRPDMRLDRKPDEKEVKEILKAMDSKGRWLTGSAMISNPYRGDGTLAEPTNRYACMDVGDETDTSPFRNTSDQEFISTGLFIRNMRALINFLEQ
jgi:PelA/Pel-15E family pectate lyase